MTDKKPNLDAATIEVMRKMLATPPKPHGEMKIGRRPKQKAAPKYRAASSKRRTASKTESDS
jgi:hypothetical protein